PLPVEVRPERGYGEIARRLAAMLPRQHVLQRQLDDEMSQRAWTNLVTLYDYDHSVFTKEDLSRLSAHEFTIDDELRAGNVDFGYEVYSLYCRRLAERVDFATNLLAKAEWDFTTNEMFRIRRKDAPWPATRAEAEEHWRKRVKNEVLMQIVNAELDGSTNRVDSAVSLTKRYRQYLRVLAEPDEEAVLQRYLSAVTRAYDPHSDYMSPTTKEDFDMEMNLSLCGVGALLQMDDGALKISEVLPGGPMDVDGRIKAGDKIVGVQQGDGEMEDIMWQPMKKSIKKIRGRKGTRVTLEIVPRSDSSGAAKKRIELVRDEIKLEDQAATGRVETVSLGGFTNRIGYVYLPMFYGTMDRRPGDEGFRSCAVDVANYLADFNAQDTGGLVLDLRGNGGGSLREAVLLSALFVPNGPVVQIRDSRSVQPLMIPHGTPASYRKPMVVLVDRASASASEIVAGHLRDTGRAVILGDVRTHGKGTVQTVLGMGPERYGSLKVTTARFYRIDGRSTQVMGVESDIHLPSLLDSLDVGEDKLTYALPFTRIRPVEHVKCWNMDKYIPELSRLSEARLSNNVRYAKHLANVKGMKSAVVDREEVPLEREARKAMMKSDRDIRETDDDDEEDGESGDDEEKPPRRRRGRAEKDDDVVLEEAFNVLSDLIRLNGGADMPAGRSQWYNAILGF
ncbi:MAG: carboxy terminal-processing peptidase, partial [Kiritimatiellae bacterium]|nr:carboxy terminal-processing peptidase [Kiritimatiellia bacterium]